MQLNINKIKYSYQNGNHLQEHNNFANNPYNTKSICTFFTGFKENKNEEENQNKNHKSLASKFSDFFSGGKIELPEDQETFIKSYVKSEQEIKDEYDKEIAAIKNHPLDFWFNISDRKREQKAKEKEQALRNASKFQDSFESRENDLLKLKTEFLEMAKHLNYSKDVIAALENERNQSLKRQEINNRRAALMSKSGFSKLAGYEYEKNILRASFIDRLDDEKAGKVLDNPLPNSILFYGPTGCGKTTFSKALAEEADCRFEKVSCQGSQEDREIGLIKQLLGYEKDDENGHKKGIKGLLNIAQEKFLEDNNRTIILIDEFDRFFGKNTSTKFISALKGIMESCSEDNHVTLFLTTNDPLKIPYELRAPHRTNIVNLDPPNENNTMLVLEHYLHDCETDDLDYNKITEELFKFFPDEMYSNSQLKSICDLAVNDIKPDTEPLTTEMFIEAVETYNKSSDNHDILRITKKYLDKYNNEKQEL